MRLLDVRRHRLKFFVGDDVPPYAILSHTWGKDEVLFEHIRDAPPTLMEMDGWKKVYYACNQARLDGYDYIWIDTCCIDKSSSAELSEAINSMFKWYLKAAICYAYLSDVNDTVPEARFENSRWFTRGWTLQELIAPSNVIFYDSAWKHITSRQGLSAAQLHGVKRVTNLPEAVLRRDEDRARLCVPVVGPNFPSHDYNAQTCRRCSRREDSLPILDTIVCAERMSWAARRETTRVEDRAYSLLGLFGVSMPLLYGEGSRAFIRLQEEILQQSHDQSLFAFVRPAGDNRAGLLAESPDLFTDSQITGFVELPGFGQPRTRPTLLSFGATARSIELEMLLYPCKKVQVSRNITMPEQPIAGEYWLALLDCAFKDDLLSRAAIVLTRAFRKRGDDDRDDLRRLDCQCLVKMSPTPVGDAVMCWSLLKGWTINTYISYPHGSQDGRVKTVRLHRSRTSAADSGYLRGNDTAASTATILRLPPRVYTYLGGAPGTGRSTDPKRIEGAGTDYDQYYIPPTSFEGFDAVSESFPEHVLGIICIRHTAAEVPFLIIWGEVDDHELLLRSESTEEHRVWCKVLSASDVNGGQGGMPGDLPGYLLRSEGFMKRVLGWRQGHWKDSIPISTRPYRRDTVSVGKLRWLGIPVYEIVVTLAKDR